jgi:CHAT domain-containing protein/tetratricopeptide (TPR) repeat protein
MLAKRFALRFRSDTLQFVDAAMESCFAAHDKLKFVAHLLVILGLSSVCAQAQVTLESRRLESGKPLESKVAGGESHTYQITLQAGQFMHIMVEQKAIGVALVLAAPDGKQMLEVNLTPAGALESLSAEATASGDHRVTVRGGGSAAIAGSYQVRLEVKATATPQDRQRIAAERWMLEASELQSQGGKTAEQTIDKLQQALAVWRELGDQYWAAWSLSSIGIAYYRLSRYEKAIECTEQALAIHREVKSRAGEAQALNNLGLDYDNLSRYEQAIGYYEQATAIYREVKDRTGEGGAFNNLGNAYDALGRYEKAIEYYEQATALLREVKARTSEGVALNNLGIAYKNLGRYEKAIGYYEQALAISREVKDRTSEGRALNNLGIAYEKLGRYEKAIAYYEQALAIHREVKNRIGEGRALDNLGIAYEKLGRYEKAIGYSEQALEIRREVKDRAGESYSLNSLARAERSQGNLLCARTRVEESLRVAESMRSDLLSPTSRSSFLANVQRSYQLYTDVLMRQHQAEPTAGFDALAVEVSERQRARSLLDLLSEARTDVRQGVNANLIERERTLAQQLNDKAQQLTQITKPQQASTLKQEVSQLETDLERAQVAIRNANPHYAALVQPQPLKLKEIQQQLDADTLLLEYALGEDRSYLWAITRDSLASYELPKAEIVDQSARQVVELLTARSTNKRGESAPQKQQRIAKAEAALPAAAQDLSQTLLAPVAAQLGNKRLVIVADGALQYIPFAMLPEPKDEGGRMKDEVSIGRSLHPSSFIPQPLIVNHEVVSLPSASALAIQRAELAGRQPAPKLLAVIADPVFDRTDRRFQTMARSSGTDASDQPQTQTQTITADDARSIEHLAENSGDKSGVTTLRLVIPRLPFTRQEATRVLALTPKNSSFGAVDFQASRATVLTGNLSQYRYVHFATHGLLDSERPGLSSLVLSMVDAEGKPQDGFLRANDIYNLKLPAELVVLSACQTGLGKEIKGEGLVGLTRGFMYAGAARVVVSLWNVNDKATADLMTKFYEKMLTQGERPAAALRAAQVEILRQKQWQSPYYWAAFTLQGEWR